MGQFAGRKRPGRKRKPLRQRRVPRVDDAVAVVGIHRDVCEITVELNLTPRADCRVFETQRIEYDGLQRVVF